MPASPLRRATEADIPALDAFLAARADIAMFPLDNLRRLGLADPARGDNPPRSLHAFIPEMGEGRDAGDGCGEGDGAVQAMVAVTDEGMLLPVAPGHDAASPLWPAAARMLAGRGIMGCCGAAPAARAMLAACRLDAAEARDADEPHYALTLDALTIPPCDGLTIERVTAATRAIVEPWRAAYHAETLGTDPLRAAEAARGDLDRAVERGSLWLLRQRGVPVAKAGINAEAGATVQVGAVYTPPDLRRRGFARRATALMLNALRGEGARRAILFAADAHAARAYEAIGFRRIGDYTLVLFRAPQRLAG